jgi:hypothetical protein
VGELTFYFDRCFGRRFPEALKRVRPPFIVEYHNGMKFKHDMPDDEWLSIVGDKGWVVFSHDKKFHRLTVEAAAIRQFNIACFYIYGASSSLWYKLFYFVRGYEKIMKIIRNEEKPFIYDLGLSGRLKKLEISSGE